MHRIVIALLAAMDAFIAAAVGIAFVLAPLSLFWATTAGTDASALWTTAASIWQLGHFVALDVSFSSAALVATGVSSDAASFVVSLAPLAFAGFTAIFAARSGVRSARSRGWLTGVLSGGLVFAALTALVALTSHNDVVTVATWQALLFPSLVYLVPSLVAALVAAWADGDDGLVDAVHDRIDGLSETWNELPTVVGRGLGIVMVGFVALGALAVLVSVVTRGGEVIALMQSNRVDLWGAILLAFVHLVYLPTLVVWGFAWVAGPGFLVGEGASVTAAGTDAGVLPSLPIFGLLPEGGHTWMYAVVLAPVMIAALAGWAMRSRYVAVIGDDEPLRERIVATLAVMALAAGGAALAAVFASGSIGPGRMAHLGVSPGLVAAAVAVEVALGVGVMMLAPRPNGGWRRHADHTYVESDERQ